MKNTFTFLLIFSCQVLLGQNIVEEGKLWYVGMSYISNPNIGTVIYSFRNDTIIDSKIYKELYVTQDSSFSDSWMPTGEFLREDSLGKVYYLNDGGEEVIYDFNFVVGDVIKLPDTWLGGCTLVVHKVDSLQLFNGEFRKRIRLVDIHETDPSNPNVGYQDWVEGIGSLTQPVDYGGCFTDFGVGLRCYQENGEVLYSPSWATDCFIVNTEDVTRKQKFDVKPNPSSDQIEIDSDDPIELITIYSMSGSQLVSSKNTVMDISDLQVGLYIVKVKFRNGRSDFQILAKV